MSRLRGSLVMGAIAGAALTAATVAWAATAPTGNVRAISLAREEVRAYARVPAERYTQTGFMEINDEEGQTSYFYFEWGKTRLASGFSWATEHALVALAHNRVVWWRDDLTPARCQVRICHQIPVEMVVERSGDYWAFGNATAHSCFVRLRGTEPVSVGAAWAETIGHYSAPVSGSRTVTLTYTYPYGRQVATESDALSATTHLVRTARTALSGGHTIRASSSYPLTAPPAPKVKLCSA